MKSDSWCQKFYNSINIFYLIIKEVVTQLRQTNPQSIVWYMKSENSEFAMHFLNPLNPPPKQSKFVNIRSWKKHGYNICKIKTWFVFENNLLKKKLLWSINILKLTYIKTHWFFFFLKYAQKWEGMRLKYKGTLQIPHKNHDINATLVTKSNP